jgi:hypothetical protein
MAAFIIFMKHFIESTEYLIECLYLEIRMSAVGNFDRQVMADLPKVVDMSHSPVLRIQNKLA